MNHLKITFLIAILCQFNICFAQSNSEIEKAKNIVIQLYKLNVYDHECHSLPPEKNHQAVAKILEEAGSDFPEKAMDLYEYKKKDRNYWEEIFNAFYVDNIALSYINQCDKKTTNKWKNEKQLDDVRFPYNYDAEASFIIKEIQFGKAKTKEKEIKFPVTVKLKNKNHFSLIYTLKLTPSGWRVFDIVEMVQSFTRDNEFVIRRTLQDEYTELKK